ncbi:SDR family oxidoreductase [Ramlibacter sp.]|uniref:SDR family oxidoreductase n=1 Tax=Ramlibacter sp. TaxID=1917967 RepID=UPI002612470C|nr:SDR family oxidoreductase [Ramlibacter sp.]MDB5958059.1 dehydrogenase with different specificity (related to short-chain alcohol dehydrogenase)-like [Ramlibacter sp.]
MSQPPQHQMPPGHERELRPQADHGEQSYRGSGKLQDKVAIITGGDSGIGRAVAIAFAREGADVVVSYLDEEDDAQETRRWIEQAGRKCMLMPGDIALPAHCRQIVKQAVDTFGRIDVLVNNAAFQMTRQSLDAIPDEEWIHTFDVNIHAMFFLCKAAVPHMRPGSAIVNTASVNAKKAPPHLLPYSATKAAIANFTASLGQLLADKGIRVNCVAPGPIWTPLIPSTMPEEEVAHLGEGVPLKRVGQPAELAPAFVFLASGDASYVTGAMVPVTGGTPML